MTQALPQVAEAMRQHAGSAAMQVAGCGVLASLPLERNALCRGAHMAITLTLTIHHSPLNLHPNPNPNPNQAPP